MDNSILTANLGLSEKEAAVYLAALELGDATVQPLAQKAGLRRTSLYHFIGNLVDLGLLERAKVRGRMHYRPRPPEELVSLQERRLEEIREALPQFAGLYNTSARKPRISYFEGPEQMRQVMLEELKCKEAWYLGPTQDVTDLLGERFMERLDRQRRERKVLLHVIRFQEKQVGFKGSDGGGDHLREVRMAPGGTYTPMTIAIFDSGKVGFLTSRKEGFGILVESVELCEAMRLMYAAYWEVSRVL